MHGGSINVCVFPFQGLPEAYSPRSESKKNFDVNFGKIDRALVCLLFVDGMIRLS